MPKVDPMQYLMDALAILTGGLIKDMQTLILGMVVCTFVVMALDILKDLLLIPALEMAGTFFANPVGAFRQYQINRRISASIASDEPGARPGRRDIEISPLRQRELDPSGSLEAVDATYANNHWERDGVELSEERYAALESAMDEAEYSERNRHRLSDEAAFDVVHSAANRLR